MMHTPRSRNVPNRSRLCSTGDVFWKPNTSAVRPEAATCSISATLAACATISLFCSRMRRHFAMSASASCAFSHTQSVVLTAPSFASWYSLNHWRSGTGMESPSTIIMQRNLQHQPAHGTNRRPPGPWRVRAFLLAILVAACPPAWCENFTTSDGVRLRYIDEGAGETLLFVPGWLMPAEIWRPQIDYFARKYRVIALDPRSQGDSQIAESGNNVG